MRRIVTQSTVWISYSLKWIDFHPSSKSFLSWLGCFMPGGCAEAPVIMTEHWSDIFMCSGREGLRSFSQMLAKSSLIRRASYFSASSPTSSSRPRGRGCRTGVCDDRIWRRNAEPANCISSRAARAPAGFSTRTCADTAAFIRGGFRKTTGPPDCHRSIIRIPLCATHPISNEYTSGRQRSFDRT